MVTLLAHIKVVPGTEARFEKIAEEMHRRSHADEADVRRYEYWRAEEPHRATVRRKRGASIPAEESMIREIAAACDVVITGSGD